ncbi:hypothetical protein PR202_gb13443 [Eleusine coracana subsp. coracana]|uniref:Uncharacterized protein n=1 Tax=Eleusine coracana subsp. coracana TaxID=191504 RepID=A0AAV5ET84_ELECO|nr:hypothetical protein PR202_gb13443 [Eleusine coracana subsp. coracana]
MRAEREAGRWRRRRRVARPRGHGRLRLGHRRRGVHRQRLPRELWCGDAGADAGAGRVGARRRPGRPLPAPVRLARLT